MTARDKDGVRHLIGHMVPSRFGTTDCGRKFLLEEGEWGRHQLGQIEEWMTGDMSSAVSCIECIAFREDA